MDLGGGFLKDDGFSRTARDDEGGLARRLISECEVGIIAQVS